MKIINNFFLKYIKTIDKINLTVGSVFNYLIILCMLLTVSEVFFRRILDNPTIWQQELCTHDIWSIRYFDKWLCI